MPFGLDDKQESFILQVSVESRNNGVGSESDIDLLVQRDSYLVELLDVIMPTQVSAGDPLFLDVVLKNRGRQEAEDTFVKLNIPALNIQERAYFGDLSAVDQADPDKEDATERGMVVNIPRDAPAGTYLLELEAYNSDSVSKVTKKFVIVGASADSTIVPSSSNKAFGTGDSAEYKVTLVNTGSKVRVYEIVVEDDDGLDVSVDDNIVAVPSGTSRTVKVTAESDKKGSYNFAVNVHSNGELVQRVPLTANVVATGLGGGSGNSAMLLLTVVLAIIFVVLLVVLIVLLTRQPERPEEGEESYY